jgi:hypothetical protein
LQAPVITASYLDHLTPKLAKPAEIGNHGESPSALVEDNQVLRVSIRTSAGNKRSPEPDWGFRYERHAARDRELLAQVPLFDRCQRPQHLGRRSRDAECAQRASAAICRAGYLGAEPVRRASDRRVEPRGTAPAHLGRKVGGDLVDPKPSPRMTDFA